MDGVVIAIFHLQETVSVTKLSNHVFTKDAGPRIVRGIVGLQC